MVNRHLALLLLAGTALAAFACAGLVGIVDLPDAADAGAEPPPSDNYVCTSSTTVLTTNTAISTLALSNGFIYGGGKEANVVRCVTTGVCNTLPNLVQQGPNTFESFAVNNSLLYFTLQEPFNSDAGGSVHSESLDGTNDTTLVPSPYPSWTAVSGTRMFWVNDAINNSNATDTTPSVVHCIGCGGGDTPWVTNLKGTSGLIADANDVYVLADDGSGNAIFGCSVQAACGKTPRLVTNGLDYGTQSTWVASDGTNVYVARSIQNDIVRIDPSGATKELVTSVSAVIAVDGSSGELFYATNTGSVGHTKADGSGAAVQIATCNGTLTAITFDATNIYVLVTAASADTVYAIKRM